MGGAKSWVRSSEKRRKEGRDFCLEWGMGRETFLPSCGRAGRALWPEELLPTPSASLQTSLPTPCTDAP